MYPIQHSILIIFTLIIFRACQQNKALYTALNLSKNANIASIVEGSLVNTVGV